MPYIPKIEDDNVRQGFIEQAQYLALREAMPDHLKAMLVVGYHCGNRLGELRKLRCRQINLGAREIRIDQKGQAKGKRPRTLPIYGDMMEWLEWRAKQRVDGCDFVFHYNGRPIGGHLKGRDRACKTAGRTATVSFDRRFVSGFVLYGVGGGVRTHGHWNHNPALYQLSYTHREGSIQFIRVFPKQANLPTTPPSSTMHPPAASLPPTSGSRPARGA